MRAHVEKVDVLGWNKYFSLSPLDLSPLEMEHLTWTALEGNPLELTHLQELGMDRKFKYV